MAEAESAEGINSTRKVGPTTQLQDPQDPRTTPFHPVPLYIMSSTQTNTTSAIGAGFGQLSKAFRTDLTLENEGAWMPVAEGIRFKVRSQQSDASRAVAKQLAEEFSAVYASGAMSTAQSDAQDVELCARALITDWEGVQNDDGSPVACTENSVREVIGGLPHLRRAVNRFSGTMDNYKPKV